MWGAFANLKSLNFLPCMSRVLAVRCCLCLLYELVLVVLFAAFDKSLRSFMSCVPNAPCCVEQAEVRSVVDVGDEVFVTESCKAWGRILSVSMLSMRKLYVGQPPQNRYKSSSLTNLRP